MKKKYRIRQGSLAWYVQKTWKPITLLLVVSLLIGGMIACADAAAQVEPEAVEPEVIEQPAPAPSDADVCEEVNTEPAEMTVEEMIIAACEQQGIDHEIPMAIARLETGHFTSRAFKEGNNVGGLSRNEVPMEFESLEAGVDAFVNCLAKYYFGKGLDTVEEIGQKYCPVNAENWIKTVKQLVGEFDGV